jgi:hypothetical protein
MKKLKKLPIVLALIVTILAAACSEIDVNPRNDGDKDGDPIVVQPPKPSGAYAPADSVSIG